MHGVQWLGVLLVMDSQIVDTLRDAVGGILDRLLQHLHPTNAHAWLLEVLMLDHGIAGVEEVEETSFAWILGGIWHSR